MILHISKPIVQVCVAGYGADATDLHGLVGGQLHARQRVVERRAGHRERHAVVVPGRVHGAVGYR